jgi:hypothetical protein
MALKKRQVKAYKNFIKGGHIMRNVMMKLSQAQLQLLSDLCFIFGFISILGSIFMWYITRGDFSPEALAHAERFGIFVGLWAPTFFILSNRFDRYAARKNA